MTRAILLLVTAQAFAQDPTSGVSFDQRIGASLPLTAPFTDDSGAAAPLGTWMEGRPTVLALVYFGCPMLCGQVLGGLAQSVRTLGLEPGKDFTLLVVSFDPRDTPGQAREKRTIYGQSWTFLTGDEASIRVLCEAVGFRYRFDASTGQFAHAAGVVVATPAGVISRYSMGIDYPARDLRLAIVESASGKVGSIGDRLLLLCYRYDPSSGRYGFYAMALLRLGAVTTVAALVVFILVALRRERRRRHA